MSKKTIMIIGGAVGVLWLAMAATCLVSAFRGLANHRLDWFVGWGLVGLLLAAGGGSALVGTWIQEYRIRRD